MSGIELADQLRAFLRVGRSRWGDRSNDHAFEGSDLQGVGL
jgi:hypothetical protein